MPLAPASQSFYHPALPWKDHRYRGHEMVWKPVRLKMKRGDPVSGATPYRRWLRHSNSRFQKSDMVSFAVSITWMTAIPSCWIYPRDTIYQTSSYPGRYPHSSGQQFVCYYLANTITISRIPKDWFIAGIRNKWRFYINIWLVFR